MRDHTAQTAIELVTAIRDGLDKRAKAIRAIKRDYLSVDAITTHELFIELIETIDDALRKFST